MTGLASEAIAYPVLDSGQQGRLRRYGTMRRATAGEILYSPADDSSDLLMVSGAVPGAAVEIIGTSDIRAGSMKRVAAAVGEGSSVIQSVHQYLTRFPDGERTHSLPDPAGRSSS